MRIYVGNIPYTITGDELRNLFGAFGKVLEVTIVTDRDTKRPRGFAFVAMDSQESASAAINALHESDLGGRRIVVNVAKERPRRSGGDRDRFSDRA